MGRFLAFLYGTVVYLFFFVTFTYAIGFVTGVAVPKTIDTGTAVPITEAIVINLLLLSLFAVQHSVMARPAFKRWWTRFVPVSIERSTFVLLATVALFLILWQWRPIPTIVWQITDPTLATGVLAVSLFGWFLVLLATFLINHFELFGLHQVVFNLIGRKMPEQHFKTPALYKIVRHPIYLGFVIAFWAAPTMTVGHLLFATVTTAYILVGIWLEERDLIDQFGDQYRRYRAEVAMLIPFAGGRKQIAAPADGRNQGSAVTTLTPRLSAVSAAKSNTDGVMPGQSFWTRVFDAIVESRTRRAEQDLSAQLPLIRDILARNGAVSAQPDHTQPVHAQPGTKTGSGGEPGTPPATLLPLWHKIAA